MKLFKSILLSITAALISTQQVYGGDHTYFKMEGQESNGFLGLAMIGLSGVINSRANFYDNYIVFPVVSGTKTLEYSGPKPFSARDLFKNLGLGLKLGYKSDDPEAIFNWATYGSLHYAENQFANYFQLDKNSIKGDNYWNRIHRMQMGVGVKGIFGSMDWNIRFSVDVALRYNLPFAYAGDLPGGKDLLKPGFSPVFSFIIVGGEKWLNNKIATVGMYYEPGTYKIFKRNDMFDNSPFKMHTVGINITWCLNMGKKI